ncbi:MAG: hypothetical protein RL662_910 [Bacteroidota bacterium]|jgi:exopolysaccharide biosynthesis polyprenyl glycosylphosphotransferase
MERLFTRRGLSIFVTLFDLVIIYFSIFLAFIFYKDYLAVYEDSLSAIITLSPYIGLCYLIIAHIFELDKPKEFTLFGVAYSVILSILCLFLLTLSISFLTQKIAYPRSIMVISSFIEITLISSWHLFINKKYLKYNVQKTVLIVGYSKTEEVARQILNSKSMWCNLKKICTPNSKHLNEYILEYDTIFLTDDVDEIVKQNISEFCINNNKEFLYEPKYQEIFLFNANFVHIDDIPMLKTRPLDIDDGSNVLKRGIDLALVIIAIVIFSIPASIVALCLKIGGGSVLYKQERVTRGGKKFFIYKFRTMIENAEAASGPVLALEADKRITKFGHFMRATRLDEIPQLYNILTGDMSIVGPRPERPFFVDQFSEEIPQYNLRHRVKAGLTGLAQVQGKYNTPAKDKLKYDLLYINNYSLALDIKLIMQTLTILLKKSSTEGIKEESEFSRIIQELTEKE